MAARRLLSRRCPRSSRSATPSSTLSTNPSPNPNPNPHQVITLGYTELNLIYYFTAGEKEVRFGRP